MSRYNSIFFFLFFLFFGFMGTQLHAQIIGIVQDEKGEGLPYANVYIEETTIGTASNPEGIFSLSVEDGTYMVVTEYLGYSTVRSEAKVFGGSSDTIRVVMVPASYSLGEVVISSDEEDPAYRIIRNAQAMRREYLEALTPFQCEVYVKGMVKFLDAPEKILGEEIGDLGGSLDSNRQGIVYLSETQSDLVKISQSEYQEIIRKSVVSGSDQGLSFNRALAADYHIYEKHIDMGREVTSPIGPGAMRFYRFKLLGSDYASTPIVHRIEVIPKNENLSAFAGEIYIQEGTWRVISLDLAISGAGVNSDFVDSMRWQQNLVDVPEMETFQRKSQTFFLYFSIFGFKGKGVFVNVYNNYNRPDTEGLDIKKGEIVKFDDQYNEKDSAFWNEARPIPLTGEEKGDYIKKDSLKRVWESEEFLDSLDRKSNKFKILDIFTGYTYSQSFEERYFEVESPFQNIAFNAVQGYNFNLKLRYVRYSDSTRWSITPNVQYGFADEQLYYGLAFSHYDRYKNDRRFSLSARRGVQQFNEADPFPVFYNTFSSLIFHRNYWRLYELSEAKFSYSQRWGTSIDFRGSATFRDRESLTNNTDFSYFYKDSRSYEANIPINASYNSAQDELRHLLAEYALEVKWTPARRFQTLPKYKLYGGSQYPTFILHWRHGLPFGDNYSEYTHVELGLDHDFDFKTWGSSDISLRAGTFLGDSDMHFADFKHFLGNQTLIQKESGDLTSFYALPFYGFSTDEAYFQGHYEHSFGGYFVDRIPILRKLGWETVAGTNLLWTEDSNPFYQEVYVGLDNIGLGLFRLLRFQVVTTWSDGAYESTLARFTIRDIGN